MSKLKIVSLLFLFTHLWSCGGGGGSSTEPNQASDPPSTPINSAPTAMFSADCLGLECMFLNESDDSDGTIISSEWSFGFDTELSSDGGVVRFNDFGDYSITLTVTDNKGETAQYEEVVSVTRDVPIDRSDWSSYQGEIEKIKAIYVDRPVTLNSSKVWFESMQVPESKFSSSSAIFPTPENPRHGVGYGSYLNMSDGSQWVFYANWVPQTARAGSAFALKYDSSGEPEKMLVKRIDGSTHPWRLKNNDGSKQVVFPGVDEGKISTNEGAAGPTYSFDPETEEWTDLGFDLGSHNSIVFDYGKDGDDDILSQNWLFGIFDGNAVILENVEGEIVPRQVSTWTNIYSHMGVAPFYYEGDKLAIVFTDAGGAGVTPERNVIGYYDEIHENLLDIQHLPIPYFEREAFQGIEQVIPEWEGNVGLSHDISAKTIDLDYDGDKDIIISSMIWSNKLPYSVLQVLINNDGTYVDETDSRLYNWLLATAPAHKLDFIDVNNDGHTDILTSDHGLASIEGGEDIHGSVLSGSKVLINDGTGHFVTVIHQQINDSGSFKPSYIPSLNPGGKLKWTVIDPTGSDETRVEVRKLSQVYSTGPSGIDPELWGEPDFNEFYYLLHNEEARTAVELGEYRNGLEHYLFVGKSGGLSTHAPSPGS